MKILFRLCVLCIAVAAFVCADYNYDGALYRLRVFKDSEDADRRFFNWFIVHDEGTVISTEGKKCGNKKCANPSCSSPCPETGDCCVNVECSCTEMVRPTKPVKPEGGEVATSFDIAQIPVKASQKMRFTGDTLDCDFGVWELTNDGVVNPNGFSAVYKIADGNKFEDFTFTIPAKREIGTRFFFSCIIDGEVRLHNYLTAGQFVIADSDFVECTSVEGECTSTSLECGCSDSSVNSVKWQFVDTDGEDCHGCKPPEEDDDTPVSEDDDGGYQFDVGRHVKLQNFLPAPDKGPCGSGQVKANRITDKFMFLYEIRNPKANDGVCIPILCDPGKRHTFDEMELEVFPATMLAEFNWDGSIQDTEAVIHNTEMDYLNFASRLVGVLMGCESCPANTYKSQATISAIQKSLSTINSAQEAPFVFKTARDANGCARLDFGDGGRQRRFSDVLPFVDEDSAAAKTCGFTYTQGECTPCPPKSSTNGKEGSAFCTATYTEIGKGANCLGPDGAALPSVKFQKHGSNDECKTLCDIAGEYCTGYLKSSSDSPCVLYGAKMLRAQSLFFDNFYLDDAFLLKFAKRVLEDDGSGAMQLSDHAGCDTIFSSDNAGDNMCYRKDQPPSATCSDFASTIARIESSIYDKEGCANEPIDTNVHYYDGTCSDYNDHLAICPNFEAPSGSCTDSKFLMWFTAQTEARASDSLQCINEKLTRQMHKDRNLAAMQKMSEEAGHSELFSYFDGQVSMRTTCTDVPKKSATTVIVHAFDDKKDCSATPDTFDSSDMMYPQFVAEYSCAELTEIVGARCSSRYDAASLSSSGVCAPTPYSNNLAVVGADVSDCPLDGALFHALGFLDHYESSRAQFMSHERHDIKSTYEFKCVDVAAKSLDASGSDANGDDEFAVEYIIAIVVGFVVVGAVFIFAVRRYQHGSSAGSADGNSSASLL